MTVLPLESHLRAMYAVIWALLRAGYEVRVAAPESMRMLFERTYGFGSVPGFSFAAAGEDWTADAELTRGLGTTLQRRGNVEFCEEVTALCLLGNPAVRMAEDVARISREWGAEAIVGDCAELAGEVVAELLSLPHVAVDNGFARLVATYGGKLRSRVAALRRAVGLGGRGGKPRRTLMTPAPPDWLLHDGSALGIDSVPFQYEPPRRYGERLPEWVADLADAERLVYVSLGSILTCAPGLEEMLMSCYARIIAALRKMKCKVVMSVGDPYVNEIQSIAPDHFHVAGRVEQSLLLQGGVDLFFSHGGYGSLIQAAWTATPVMLMPLSSDQPFNADRSHFLGYAGKVSRDADADTIRAAVADMLWSQNERYRRAMGGLRRRCLALTPADVVLDRVLTEKG